MKQLQKHMSDYLQKLRTEIDKAGLGQAALPYLKDNMREKMNYLVNSLNN